MPLVKAPKIEPVVVKEKRKYTKKPKTTRLTWTVPTVVTITLLAVCTFGHYAIGYYELKYQLGMKSEKLDSAVSELTKCYGQKSL